MKQVLIAAGRIRSLAGPRFRTHVLTALGAGLAPVLYNLMLSQMLRDAFAAATQKSFGSLAGALLFFALGSAGFFFFNGLFWGLFGASSARITGSVKKAMFAHFCALPAAQTENGGAEMALFTGDTVAVESLYGTALRYAVSSVLSGSVAAAVLFCESPAMGAVILATGLVQLLFNLLLVKPLERLSRRIAREAEEAGMALGRLLDGAVTIKLYGLERRELEAYEAKSRELARLNRRYSAVEGVIRGGNLLAGLGGYLITLAFGTWMAARGALDLPGLLFLTQTRLLMMLVILAVGEFAEQTQPALAAAARIAAFLDKPAEKRQYEADESEGG